MRAPTSPYKFTFVPTEDESLTLRIESTSDVTGGAAAPQSSESMHSLRGAFSETAYIYGSAIDRALEEGCTPRVLSLGLGLGYVELLAVALMLKKARATPATDTPTGAPRTSLLEEASGESFELLEPLRRWFVNWLLGQGELPDDFRSAYDDILARTAEHTGVPAQEIKELLAQLVREGRWKIREALDADTQFGAGFGCICFDAFSSKTSPELWTEDFLKEFFARACEQSAVLSTYACTGALKRALKASGFEVTIREGFSSKRDSTFAVRHPVR